MCGTIARNFVAWQERGLIMIGGIRLIALVGGSTFAAVSAAYIQAGSYLAALPFVMLPTAHVAFALFWMAFSASSLHALAPSPYSKWAMKNRRYIGLSFALVHSVHLVLVLSNITANAIERPFLILLAGATAYFFLFLMAATSNNASVKMLGAKNWRHLHTIGSWYIWMIFMSALPEIFTGKFNRIWIFALGLTALYLRVKTYRQQRAKPAAQAT